MKYYYHATPIENVGSILKEGLHPSLGYGCVFMTEEPEEALRFAVIRALAGERGEVAVIRIKTLKADEEKIEETFDHNPDFFKCRSYGFFGEIPPENVKWVLKWEPEEAAD